MKLTEISLGLLVLLVGGLCYSSFDALKLQRENNAKMAEIHRYFDAVQDQLDAQKKLQAESGVAGLVTPLDFQGAAPAASAPSVSAAPVATVGTAGSARAPEVAAPTTPEPAPASVTAVVAPLAPVAPLPAPVIDTPQMRVIRDAPSIGAVTGVNGEHGFVTLDAGSAKGLAAGQIYQLRRQASVVGSIRISAVEPDEAAADLDPKSVPPGVAVLPGDQIITPVKLMQ
jgi:hypothetical protein